MAAKPNVPDPAAPHRLLRWRLLDSALDAAVRGAAGAAGGALISVLIWWGMHR
jgi:hypothetical protein